MLSWTVLTAVPAIYAFGQEPVAPPGGMPPEVEELLANGRVLLSVVVVVGPPAYWVTVSALMQLNTRLFGGTGDFRGTLATVGLAFLPLVLLGVLLPLARGVIGFGDLSGAALWAWMVPTFWAPLAWHVALVIVGAHAARGVEYPQACAACAVSCLGLVGVGLVAFVAFFFAANLLVS